MLREEAPRKSRRELRREREKARGGLARRVVGRRSRASKAQNTGDLYREDGLPKSRRAVREFYERA